MIVSDKYKFVFIRIPKTATTSIENALLSIDPDCRILPEGDYELPPYGHYTDEQIKNKIGIDKWNSYFKFACFRNPIDRAISAYVDMAKYTFDNLPVNLILTNVSHLSHDFKSTGIIEYHDLIKSYSLSRDWFWPKGVVSQCDWISLNEMDYIIDFSDLELEWEYIQSKLRFDSPLQHSNKTMDRLHFNISLDEKSTKLVELLYEDDFEYYKQLKQTKKDK